MMYEFDKTMHWNETFLPRILAEDTGAPELCDPMAFEKTPFKFRKPGWFAKKKNTAAYCQCSKPCAASC